MVPRHRRITFGRRAFSVAGPVKWNSLSNSLSTDIFRSALGTHLFAALRKEYSALEALRDALTNTRRLLLS